MGACALRLRGDLSNRLHKFEKWERLTMLTGTGTNVYPSSLMETDLLGFSTSDQAQVRRPGSTAA